MALLLDLVSWICILAGAAAALIGGLGLLRLPDVFARMHGAGMIDTLGLSAILVGLMIQAGFTLVTVKLLLVVLFVLYTSPVVTHALARACLNAGIQPQARHKPSNGGGPSKR
ncbi:MAG: monovalent cation/H(+) antiporter subunit G [Geminicoccaceae bacterium]